VLEAEQALQSIVTHCRQLCRLPKRQVKAMRESGVPMQLINGKNDLVAGVCWVKKLAKQLKCPLILTGKPP